MTATVTNCYIGGAGTSATAKRDLRSVSAAQHAPNDFFSYNLFNNSAVRVRQKRLNLNFQKVDLLECVCRIGIDRDGYLKLWR